jgi:hypothetical protein
VLAAALAASTVLVGCGAVDPPSVGNVTHTSSGAGAGWGAGSSSATGPVTGSADGTTSAAANQAATPEPSGNVSVGVEGTHLVRGIHVHGDV